VDANLITNSDHNMVTCLLNTMNIIRNHSRSKGLRYGNVRTIYEYDKMTKDMWQEYERLTEEYFESSDVGNILQYSSLPAQIKVDLIWNKITDIFNKAAKIIPSKKI